MTDCVDANQRERAVPAWLRDGARLSPWDRFGCNPWPSVPHQRTATHEEQEAEARDRKVQRETEGARERPSTLRGQLTKTEKKLTKARERAERWKTEAKAQKKSAAKAEAGPRSCSRSWTGHLLPWEQFRPVRPLKRRPRGNPWPSQRPPTVSPCRTRRGASSSSGPRPVPVDWSGCPTSRRHNCSPPCPELRHSWHRAQTG